MEEPPPKFRLVASVSSTRVPAGCSRNPLFIPSEESVVAVAEVMTTLTCKPFDLFLRALSMRRFVCHQE